VAATPAASAPDGTQSAERFAAWIDAGRAGNVAIAMGNSGDHSFISRLEAWADSEDPVLSESAAWALERLRSASIEATDSRAIQER